jgi:Holliday junction DNA helicase RuvA
MFAHITGTLIHLEQTKATIEIHGIGLALEVFLSPLALGDCLIGKEVSFPLHHHITEAGQTLFGFRDHMERAVFRKLLGVSGVGGKTAQNILGLGVENILRAIELQDDKLLASVPGIGKKTAQKIIVDLKGSIDFASLESNQKSKAPKIQSSNTSLISSLVQMGYDKARVEDIVADIDSNLSLEIRTVEAIKQLSK